MDTAAEIDFGNTQDAFAYKTDRQLKKAYRLFSLLRRNLLVRAGTFITPFLLKLGHPFRHLLRFTLFEQFVGGESLQETAVVTGHLATYNVQVILDYGVENSEGSEAERDQTRDAFLRVITFASTQPNIPFISIKVTALARFSLLEKMDALMQIPESSLLQRYQAMLQLLPAAERQEWDLVAQRLHAIFEAASQVSVGVLVDAEESWIQQPLDAFILLKMRQYNRDQPLVYNTVQLYRNDRLKFLYECHQEAQDHHFILGVKLVRGAYMEKERERARIKEYPSPIHERKELCDTDFDAAVSFCLERVDSIATVIATHNEWSNQLAARLIDATGKKRNHPHFHFSQLFGMSDHLTFNLSKAGFSVSKYVPFGPVQEVVPYLMRRAKENTSISGQTGREFRLIQKEMKRRKLL